jgi:hypothetical protein
MNFERIDCQYCQDVGLCTFCERGQQAIAEYQKSQEKSGSNKSEEVKEDISLSKNNPSEIKIVPVEERDDPWKGLMGGGN